MMRRRSKTKKGGSSKRKAGKPYEEAVRDLCRSIFPNARIESGVWVEGPDVRRELDVDIRETVGGQLMHVVIECKDFNRRTTGPVGIAYIDALDSKRQDLGLHSAFICSNAGYTADAIRKAKRVGIGLLGASRHGDERIRFALEEEVYIRHVRIAECRLQYFDLRNEPVNSLEGVDATNVLYCGRSVGQWLWKHVVRCLTINPIAQGWIRHDYSFIDPVFFEWSSGCVEVSRIDHYVRYEGAWFAQTVRLNSSLGLYHHLRRRMIFPRGAWSLRIEGIHLHKGGWISLPPLSGLDRKRGVPGEFEFNLLVIKKCPKIEDPARLDECVRSENIDPFIADITTDMIQSVEGFELADPGDGDLSRITAAEWSKLA